ncbi:MAG: hypothetical protein ACFB9M_16065 [Myxococcota bacterium]
MSRRQGLRAPVGRRRRGAPRSGSGEPGSGPRQVGPPPERASEGSHWPNLQSGDVLLPVFDAEAFAEWVVLDRRGDQVELVPLLEDFENAFPELVVRLAEFDEVRLVWAWGKVHLSGHRLQDPPLAARLDGPTLMRIARVADCALAQSKGREPHTPFPETVLALARDKEKLRVLYGMGPAPAPEQSAHPTARAPAPRRPRAARGWSGLVAGAAMAAGLALTFPWFGASDTRDPLAAYRYRDGRVAGLQLQMPDRSCEPVGATGIAGSQKAETCGVAAGEEARPRMVMGGFDPESEWSLTWVVSRDDSKAAPRIVAHLPEVTHGHNDGSPEWTELPAITVPTEKGSTLWGILHDADIEPEEIRRGVARDRVDDFDSRGGATRTFRFDFQ